MRITVNVLKDRIATVKALAESLSLDQLTYNGYKFSDLSLACENNSIALVAKSSGRTYITSARGNREIYHVLSGMIVTLEAVKRFNS